MAVCGNVEVVLGGANQFVNRCSRNIDICTVPPHPDGVVRSLTVATTAISDANAVVIAIVKIIELC